MKTTRWSKAIVAAALGLLLGGAAASRGADGTWSGPSTGSNPNFGNLWSNAGNWQDGVIPGTVDTTSNTDSVSMPTQGHFTIELDNNYNVQNLYHNVGAHGHAIATQTGHTLSLTSGGAITGVGGGRIKYFAPVRLEGGSGGSYAFLGERMEIFSPVVGTAASGGNYDLILGGVGQNNLVSTSGSYIGSLGDGAGGGTLSLVKTGTGAWSLVNAGTYTGTTTLRNGILRFSNANSFGTGTSAITLADSDTGASDDIELRWNENITLSRDIVVNNFNSSGTTTIAVRDNRGGPQLSGLLTLNRDLTFRNENSGHLTVSGQITGSGGIVKTGPNNLTLSNVGNTYQGGTTVNAGLLIVGVAGPLASSPVTVNGGVLRANQGVGLGAANSLSLSGGVWESSAHITRSLGSGAGQVKLSGNSGFSAQGGAINVNLGGSGDTLVWGSTPGFNPATLVLNQTTANNTLNFQNALDLNGTDRAVAVNANAATISGAIGNASGTAGLTKSGIGTLNLTGLNTFNGGLTLNAGTLNVRNTHTLVSEVAVNAGTLNLDYANQNTGATWVPASTPLTMRGGTFSVTGSGVADQTTAQTVNGLTLAGGASTVSATASGGRPVVLNLGAITRTTGTANFVLPAGTQGSGNGITTSTGAGNTRLGMWATVNGNDWAAKSADNVNIVPWSSVGGTYQDVTRLSSGSKTVASDASSELRIIDGTGSAGNITPAAAGTTDVASIFAAVTGGTATYAPGSADVLRVGAAGTIALTGATGSGALTLGAAANQGVLTAGGADDSAGTITFVNNHPSNLILVNSSIADNGTGAVGVESAGLGITAFARNASYTYTGTTTINDGVIRIEHDSGNSHPVDRSLGGTTVLNGGTLRFQHMGAGHFNPSLTFTSPIHVSANGGTIDFAGAANNFSGNSLSAPVLNGNLTVSGITGNASVLYNFTAGTLTLNSNAKITNATGPSNPHTIRFGPDISGATRTLTLARSGSGTGFRIDGATASSLNLGNILVDEGATFGLYGTANGVNPLAQIKTNGGTLTMGPSSALMFQGSVNASGPLFDPTAIVWQGDNTLTIERDIIGNLDTYLRIVNANLEVSAASGLTTFNAMPWRAYYTVDSPYALIIAVGGRMNYTVGSNVRETFRGNLTLLDGAIVTGINSSGNQGGIIRDTTGGGTLTLGDGNASIVTFQGNHGTGSAVFKIGFATHVTDNGSVTQKVANTSAAAGAAFNFGWSASAATYTSALNAFQETSGGTEFAPLAGSGGVAIVGASAGTVATFANPATLTTSGTVGFYNAGANNTRGALGPVAINGTGTLAFEAAGTVRASDATFASGSVLTVRLAGAAADACSLLDVTGTLTFDSGSAVAIAEDPGLQSDMGPWYVAQASTLSGVPNRLTSGFSVAVEDNKLRIERVPPGTVFMLR